MRSITRFIVLVLIGCSLATGTASANAGFSDIVYVEKVKEVPSGKRTSLSVFCPGGRPIVSGGIHITGTDLSIEVASTAPIDGRRDADKIPDDGWRAAANNDSGETETMTVRAQCAGKIARKHLRYVSAKWSLDAGSFGGLAVDCADGYIVIAGGVSTGGTSTRIAIISTRAQDNLADADSVPDNLWTAEVLNESPKVITNKTSAICAKKTAIGGEWSYPSKPLEIPPSTQASASIVCSSGIAFGGGIARTSPTSNIASLEMVQTPDGTSDGWLAWINNPTTQATTVQVQTICWAD